ncbi:Galectin-9 [Halotydeus destructor]|nr:Galectin-9 [Halotydeus destructor]
MNIRTVLRPPVPFVAQVPGGVAVGTQVVIEGHVPSWFCDQFNINLLFGHNATLDHVRRADIAFHFNPRLNERLVVINHRFSGHWGAEHRELDHMPVRKGCDFEIRITVKATYFHVTIDGNHYINFPRHLAYRYPDHACAILWVDGDVDLKKVQFAQLGSVAP